MQARRPQIAHKVESSWRTVLEHAGQTVSAPAFAESEGGEGERRVTARICRLTSAASRSPGGSGGQSRVARYWARSSMSSSLRVFDTLDMVPASFVRRPALKSFICLTR
jgi:hypothetical protein